MFSFQLSDNGLLIEKGVSVYVSVSGTNQDPKYFSNPLEFNPCRAQRENKRFYETLAFGIGPRSCIGWFIKIYYTNDMSYNLFLIFSFSMCTS